MGQTWTTPLTWSDGVTYTAATLNQQVRDNFNFLARPDSARVWNVGQTVTAGTVATPTFGRQRWDNNTLHSFSTNTERLTLKQGGRYLAGAHISWAFPPGAGSSNTVEVRLIAHTGGNAVIIATERQIQLNIHCPTSITSYYDMATGDYFTCDIKPTTAGGTTENFPGYTTELWCLWITG